MVRVFNVRVRRFVFVSFVLAGCILLHTAYMLLHWWPRGHLFGIERLPYHLGGLGSTLHEYQLVSSAMEAMEDAGCDWWADFGTLLSLSRGGTAMVMKVGGRCLRV